ncbi:MAG: hypothetical protein HYZ53_25690 [Planctomycetes bacterium]|nr:hypothetical protein [Planctomycetota bacterium]
MIAFVRLQLLELTYDLDSFGPYLRPFSAAFTASPGASGAWRPWLWSDPRVVRARLGVAWNMLGCWQARRGVVVDLESFRRTAEAPILALAAVLNKRRTICIADLLELALPQ